MKATLATADVVKSVTFSVDTSAYASGDLIADTQEIDGVGFGWKHTVVLDSITLIDESDQKVALSFVFLNASTSLGTENSAPNISDANATAAVLGQITFAATDYVDLGGVAVATKANLGLVLQTGAATDSLYVAIVNSTGTPTYGAADDLTGKFGFRRTEKLGV